MDPAAPNLFLRRLGQWTLICAACAIPSTLWAGRQFDPQGMAAGVGVFIVAYAFVTSRAAFARVLDRPGVRTTLRVGFGFRVAVSVVFPLGMAADLYPGMVSMELVRRLDIRPETLGGTFLTTVVQGALLNLILGLFMVPLYGLMRASARPIKPDPNICPTCRYDVRASREFGRCPECGGAIPAP